MDSLLLNNGFDLHVAPTTAGAAAVKVSPNRPLGSLTPAEQDVFTVFTWSADGKYLAFSADLTENGFDQAYVVDTSVASPAAVELLGRADIATQASGAQGVRGALLFDNQNNVYFRARIQTGSTQFQIFRATPAGARTVFALPARADTSTPDAGAFAISPDGTKIVFSADAPTLGAHDLYVATLAAPTPAKLTSLAAAGNANFTAPMAISPDGTKIALVADFLGGDGNDEPYVVHLDGSTQAPRRLISLAATCTPAGCTNVDALAVQWTADGGAVYVLGDIATSNDTRVFRADPAVADQAPVLTVTTPTGGDITDLLVRPIP
jgi:Tol biopolymer transport system component